MIGVEHILGGGVELRALGAGHAEELFGVIERNRERLKEWLPGFAFVRSVEDEREFLQKMEQQAAEDVAFVSGIFVQGKVVGTVGILPVDRANRKVDMGYWVDQGHEGKGLVTAACQVVIGYLFESVGLNRVTIYCATGNSRSRAVAERLGFTLEGVHREAERLGDRYGDLACYAMLKREWK